MKIKRNKQNNILLINLLLAIIFILPIKYLDLFLENYSTLSLNIKGYLFLLCLGILIGLLLFYETKIISNLKYAYIILISLIIGVIIPHHIPYNLQGNLHLLFAYIGFAGLVIITYLNINYYPKLKNIYLVSLLSAILIFIKVGMVNTLSEIIVMLASLFSNYMAFKKATRDS